VIELLFIGVVTDLECLGPVATEVTMETTIQKRKLK